MSIRSRRRVNRIHCLAGAILVWCLMASGAAWAQQSPAADNSSASAAQAAVPPNMVGRTLTIGTKIAPPFVYRGPNGQLTGLSIDLWNQVAKTLGFKTHYVIRPLQGLFTGLENGSLDVSVAALTVTPAREDLIDFSFPFYTTGLAIAVRQGGGGSPVWQTIKRFFSWQFFTALGTLTAVLLLVGVVIWLAERRRNPEEFGGSTVEGIGAGFWWAAVTMTTVGYGDKSPRTLFGRLVGLAWMFAAIIIISSFTAAIATSLTVGSLASGIQNENDLRNARVITVAHSAATQALRARGIDFSTRNSLPAALDALAAGDADAVVYDEPLLKYLIRHHHAGQLHVLDTTFDRQDYAFALPENSPLREPIDRAILTVMNADDWNAMVLRFLGRKAS